MANTLTSHLEWAAKMIKSINISGAAGDYFVIAVPVRRKDIEVWSGTGRMRH